ncbi:unnamed protein product [Cunninghamella blakesleeana]
MRISLFATAALLFSQSFQAFADVSTVTDDENDYVLVDGPDHEYNQHGQWVHLTKRYGDTCSKYHTVSYGETCSVITSKYGIRLDELYTWNSQINSKCTNLKPTKKYCVRSNGAALAGGCTKWHKVSSTDTCTKVANKYGLTTGQFYDLNDSVNRGKCDNLYTGKSYCVQVHGSSSSSNHNSKKVAMYKKKKHHANKKKKSNNKKKSSSNKKKSSSSSSSANKKKQQEAEKKKETQKKKQQEAQKKKQEAEKKKQQQEDNKKKEDENISNKITNLKQRHLLRRNARLTYYWTAHPEDYNSGGKKVTIKTCSGKNIATIAQDYADALVMEGSGVISKSKIVNLGGCSCSSDYKCFMELDANKEPFGLTSYGTSLQPFITIAANDLKRDTKIFVPSIQGWKIPNSGKTHNGCLLVSDQSWSFGSNHIDLFVNFKAHYKTLNNEHGVTNVDIYEGGDCKLLDYS